MLANPIASDLDCMRPSILPNLIEAAGRNAKRGFPDAALFEIGPVFAGDRPQDQRAAIGAVLAPHPPRSWQGRPADDLYALKGDLTALLEALGAPVGSLQLVQGDDFALVDARPVRAPAARPQGGAGRVRRDPSARAQGARRGGAALRLRGLGGGDPRAQAEGRQVPPGLQALAA